MSMTRLFAFLLLFCVAGCGTYHWDKAGAGEDQFAADAKACDQPGQSGGFTACMNGRGWTYRNY